MEINIFVLQASGRLKPHAEIIRKIATNTVKKVKKKMPISHIDIVIYDNPQEVIEELGIGGYAPNAHTVLISLNPEFSDFDKTISEQLERILVHELHHPIRWRHTGYGKTLLEALITEGLADHFDVELTGKNPQLWDMALTSEQIHIIGEKAKSEYNNKDYNHDEWFYGAKDKGIPKWSGYALGYNLVYDYLKKHPNKKPSELYAVKAEEFLPFTA